MLAQEQINEITSFCESKGVKYYDVQMELVDHIANMIEQKQILEVDLSFSDALGIVGEEFTDAEFTAIVKSEKRKLRYKMSKLIENEFLSFFTHPRLSLTVASFIYCLLFPYLVNWIGIWVPFISYAIIIVFISWYQKPPSEEARLIKDNLLVPMLSFKIKTRYEYIVRIIELSIALYFLLYRTSASSSTGLAWRITNQMILSMQGLLMFTMFFFILSCSVNYSKRNFYKKIMENYPKAFAQ